MEPGSKHSDDDPRGRALSAALRLLTIRGRSRHEVRLALEKKGFSSAIVSEVIGRLEELGYLDDATFATRRAEALLRNGRFGGRAVLQRLRAHGLNEAEARRALAAAEAELKFDPRAAAVSLLESRGLAGRALEPKEKAKAARLLLGRGFSQSLVAELVGEGEE